MLYAIIVPCKAHIINEKRGEDMDGTGSSRARDKVHLYCKYNSVGTFMTSDTYFSMQ